LQDCESLSSVEVERTIPVIKETLSSGDEGTSAYYLPPPTSAPVCLPPNPDPPPFDAFAEPFVIEVRGSSPSYQPEAKKVDPFYADSLDLQREILNPGGVEIYVSTSDLLRNVAIVELGDNLWIGGWNPRVPNLHSLFHLGDLLVSINGHNVHTQRQVRQTVEATKRWATREQQRRPDVALYPGEVKCRLRLRRLPLAKTLIVCRQTQDQKIGVTFDDSGTNKVKSIDPEGPLACTGLLPFASAFFKKPASVPLRMSVLRLLGRKQTTSISEDFVPWTATEINHRPLNPFFKQHEVYPGTFRNV
uniref:PDZ domain-containing protein n=1 Tax=Hydatigena taeniaeformis TaxID=6205 RepID=A0A0R3X7X5_HYDTA